MDDPDSGDAHPGEYPLFDRTEAWPATGDGGRLCLFARPRPRRPILRRDLTI